MSPPGRRKGEDPRAPRHGMQRSTPGVRENEPGSALFDSTRGHPTDIIGESLAVLQARSRMGTGLLTGLARRALGFETPLRSQRSTQSGSRTATSGVGHADGVFEGLADLPAPDERSLLHGIPEAFDKAARAGASPSELALAAQGGALLSGLVQGQARRAESVSDQRSPGALQKPSATGLPAALLEAQRGDARNAEALVASAIHKPGRAADSPRLDGLDAASQKRSGSVMPPRPLMPQQDLQTLLRLHAAASGALADPGRGSLSAGPRAQAAPTEVHVSIGRVELTAAAPSAAARPRPRRAAADGHSLTDYLHGKTSADGRGGAGGKGSSRS